ncbi:transposase [Nocardia sp. NPDC004278]
MAGRADLTDAQWTPLEPSLPRNKKPSRPPKWTKRPLIDGIRWRVRVGSPWRDVPLQYGPWQTVYGLFRRWQRTGIWALIHARKESVRHSVDGPTLCGPGQEVGAVSALSAVDFTMATVMARHRM